MSEQSLAYIRPVFLSEVKESYKIAKEIREYNGHCLSDVWCHSGWIFTMEQEMHVFFSLNG